MGRRLLNGYCYGGPAHGEYFNSKMHERYLTIPDSEGGEFTYKLQNIPLGSNAYHWLPADIPDEKVIDFAFETVMADIMKSG